MNWQKFNKFSIYTFCAFDERVDPSKPQKCLKNYSGYTVSINQAEYKYQITFECKRLLEKTFFKYDLSYKTKNFREGLNPELLSGYSVYNRVNFHEYNKLKFICLANGFEYEEDENHDFKMFLLYFGVIMVSACVCSFFWMAVTNWIFGVEWAILTFFIGDRDEEEEEHVSMNQI